MSDAPGKCGAVTGECMCREGVLSVEATAWSKSKGPKVYPKLNNCSVPGVHRLMKTEHWFEKQERRGEVGLVREEHFYKSFALTY